MSLPPACCCGVLTPQDSQYILHTWGQTVMPVAVACCEGTLGNPYAGIAWANESWLRKGVGLSLSRLAQSCIPFG